jgi:hypothetical protein
MDFENGKNKTRIFAAVLAPALFRFSAKREIPAHFARRESLVERLAISISSVRER